MHVPFGQLKAEAQLVHELYGEGPHRGGLSVRKIAVELGHGYNWAWRRWRWYQAMMDCYGFLPRNRACRLPFIDSAEWDQTRYETLVARRAKVLELLAVDEAMSDAAETTRAGEKDRKDAALDWLAKGGDPPAWLKDTLGQ